MKEVWTRQKVEEALIAAQGIVSLNELINAENGDEELELYIQDPSPSPEEELIKAEVSETVRKCIDTNLSEREAAIIKARFGIYTDEPITLEELGTRYNLTRERIRQIEMKAIRKLRFYILKNNITEEDI